MAGLYIAGVNSGAAAMYSAICGATEPTPAVDTPCQRHGVDVSADGFVTAVREKQPDILGMSALLTTTMPAMSKVIDALKEVALRERVKVLIGGHLYRKSTPVKSGPMGMHETQGRQ